MAEPARTQEDFMTELTLHPADDATAARPHALLGIKRAVGARIDAIGVGQRASIAG